MKVLKIKHYCISLFLLLNLTACQEAEVPNNPIQDETNSLEPTLPEYEEARALGAQVINTQKNKYHRAILNHSIVTREVNYKHYIEKKDLEKHTHHSIHHLFDYIKQLNNGTECAYITVNNKVIHNPNSIKGYFWGQYFLNGKEYQPALNHTPYYLQNSTSYFYIVENNIRYNYKSSKQLTSNLPIANRYYSNCSGDIVRFSLPHHSKIGISGINITSTGKRQTNFTNWFGKVSVTIDISDFFQNLLPSIPFNPSFQQKTNHIFYNTNTYYSPIESYDYSNDNFELKVKNATGLMLVYEMYDLHTYNAWATIRPTGSITYSLLKTVFAPWDTSYTSKFNLIDKELSIDSYYQYLNIPLSQLKHLGYLTIKSPIGTEHINLQRSVCY
ncbi:hypothetical protein [Tenacibaculum xiamenense]|uniref:hypothetical protein n=1 Tax=Tenacibaculum xiamenense TaxID=1261553 RepID=UPI0038953034